MSLAVFFDVVLRLAASQGPLDRFWGRLLPAAHAADAASLVTALGLSLFLAFMAFRTAKVKSPPSVPRALAYAAGTVAGTYAAVKLLQWLFPNGLIWSQVFALCGMLWVGFLGASLATHERAHLTLEIMEFLWRGRVKAHIGRFGAFFAAAFCAVLGYLSWLNVRYHLDTWLESDGAAGVFDAFPAPKFIVFGIMPVSFTVMALRFLARAVGPTEEEKAPELQPVMAPPPEEPAP